MIKIKVENVSKSFGKHQVLKGISFDVENGSFLSLLGPSGCGKTTMLRIISGLEYPDEGRILVNGKDLTSVPAEKRNIGMVFQNYALIPHMTVFGNVSYGLKIRKVPKPQIRERVSKIISLVGLGGKENRKITKLSGGEQQRVALARALVIEPEILLLDEPLAALDRKIRSEMQYEIRRIQHEVGITTVFVTHDQEEAMTMSDNIILMNYGAVAQYATPEHMYNHPDNLFISDFLGKSNILKGRLVRRDGQPYVESKGWIFKVNEQDIPENAADELSVVIRGEQFMLHDAAVPGSCELTVANKVFTGVVCKLICRAGDDTIDVICINSVAANITQGDKIYVTIVPDFVHCFAE